MNILSHGFFRINPSSSNVLPSPNSSASTPPVETALDYELNTVDIKKYRRTIKRTSHLEETKSSYHWRKLS